MTTVVFDVGNVLLDWDARRIFRDHFETDTQIESFFDEIDFHAWNLEQDRGRTWADGVAHLSAAHPHHAPLIARADSHWHESVSGPIHRSVQALESLTEAGHPVYAITNFSAEKWAECRDRFPFLTLFRDVVVSAHERLVKPDPAIYRVLLDRNGLTAGDCLFIDDSAANVAGAQAIGMDAILFRDPGDLVRDLRDRGLPVGDGRR